MMFNLCSDCFCIYVTGEEEYASLTFPQLGGIVIFLNAES